MDVKFNDIFKRALTRDELGLLNKTDLVELVTVYQAREGLLIRLLSGAMELAEHLAEASLAVSKRLFKTLDLLFGQSLKSKPHKKIGTSKPRKKPPTNGKSRPSERYANMQVTEVEVAEDIAPRCSCGHEMTDSGMRETSERIEAQPKKFFIFRYNRVKYTCRCCHLGIATAPAEPQIIPGSCYGDSFVQDVVLSKMCDLIPISRYTAMAERQGFEGFPTNSFYEFPRHLAIFLRPSLTRLTNETKQAQILQADETRHRMLEGSERKNWYLWSFNSPKGVVYRVEDTRASEIASEFLKDCACRVLLSDAYHGYSKALTIVNRMRSETSSDPGLIATAYCNAHARNNFASKSIVNTQQAKRMLWVYKIAFAHYPTYRDTDGDKFAKAKATIERAFDIMKRIAVREMPKLSSKSMLYDALNYFDKYYSELTLFLSDRSIPMHNNQSERTLRNHVIGRKTWYGTHSPAAARDLAKIMSIVESCKMLEVNPREFVADAVKRVHQGLLAVSPYEFKQLGSRNSS